MSVENTFRSDNRLAEELAEERRRAAEIEHRYRGLIDRLDAIFWEADAATFEFTYVSPRAEPLLGYPMERWLHEPGFWVTILHSDDRDWVVDCCATATREGRDNDFEYRALTADGRVVWLRDMVYLELDEAGKPRLLKGVMLDITAQKKVEDALRESGAAKDRFLAMLAHELRNPLGAVSNALEVMRATPPGQPVWQRALEVVERQVKHQTQLLNDLLEVSRLSRGKIERRRERVDLGLLVQQSVEDCRESIANAGLTASLGLPSHAVWVEGDPTQLAQVFTNLLNNAVKFTEAGGRIDVSVADAEGSAQVAVADTGIGIDPAMLGQVWGIFNQADSSLERSRGGLGLGLALVKGLTELHGGEVQAQSPGLGQGARFTVSLPIAGAPAVAEPDRAEEPAAAKSLRILVIEDNVDAAETLGDLLRLFEHEVELAHSGPAGIEAAARFQPEVVLCDIGLPMMDGYEVARQLRQNPALKATHLIALTGYGRESDRRRALEAGFDLHLVKPVEPLELQRLLTEWAVAR
jgi:PAS domain S-box-containing protein